MPLSILAPTIFGNILCPDGGCQSIRSCICQHDRFFNGIKWLCVTTGPENFFLYLLYSSVPVLQLQLAQWNNHRRIFLPALRHCHHPKNSALSRQYCFSTVHHFVKMHFAYHSLPWVSFNGSPTISFLFAQQIPVWNFSYWGIRSISCFRIKHICPWLLKEDRIVTCIIFPSYNQQNDIRVLRVQAIFFEHRSGNGSNSFTGPCFR